MTGLATGLLLAFIAVSHATTLASAKTTPVSRVVQLLQALQSKIEADGKAEEKLYKQYKCWCDKTSGIKEAAIAEAEALIPELEAQIDDLQAGKVDLTDEKVTLTKELKDVTETISEAEAIREKELGDFAEAEQEMTSAIAALSEAVTVLDEATTTSFADVKSRLRRALDFGSSFLNHNDVRMVDRALEDPEYDWKKLNRKAVFKMKYKARSVKIQDILADMLKTFQENWDEAQAKETKRAGEHKTFMDTKNKEKKKIEDALSEMALEKAARAKRVAELSRQKEDTEAQLGDDISFLANVKKACSDKDAEWEERIRLRGEELKGIAEAIAILHSDDARDTFTRSFAEFVQVKSTTKHCAQRKARAVALLQQLATERVDLRLAVLAANSTGAAIDEVVVMIDKMVSVLEGEQKEDDTKTSLCRERLNTLSIEAHTHAVAVDDATAEIARLNSEIKRVQDEVSAKNEQIAAINETVLKATRVREDETKEWQRTTKDDADAVALLEQAIAALQKYEADRAAESGSAGALVQVRRLTLRSKQEPAANEIAPPPNTWEGDYKGASGEKAGIVAILSLIKDDISKDITEANSAEQAAQAAFEKLKQDSQADIDAMKLTITDLQGEEAGYLASIGDQDAAKSGAEDSLTGALTQLADQKPGCDYLMKNVATRTKFRTAEIDGLKKAKAILKGAVFDAPDPNRELKPGDAMLLQQNDC